MKELFKPTRSKILTFIFISLIFIPFILYDTGVRCITAPCPSGTPGSLLMYLLFSHNFYIYYISYTTLIIGLFVSYIISCALVEKLEKRGKLRKVFTLKFLIIISVIFIAFVILARSNMIYDKLHEYYREVNPESCKNEGGGWVGSVDYCYFKVAIARNDVTFCDNIQKENTRYACYLRTAKDNKNEQVCEQIESKFSFASKEACIKTVRDIPL